LGLVCSVEVSSFRRVLMASRDSGPVSASFDVLLDPGHARMLHFYTPQQIQSLETKAHKFFKTHYGLDYSLTTPIPISPTLSLPGYPSLGLLFAPYGTLPSSWKITLDTLHDDRSTSLWNLREFGIILYSLKKGTFPGGLNAGMPYDADAAIGFVHLNFLKSGEYDYMDPNCACREILECRGSAPSNPVVNEYGLRDRIIKLNCTDERGADVLGLMLNVLKPVNGNMSDVTQINRNVWTWPCPGEEDICPSFDSTTELCIASAYKLKDAQLDNVIMNGTLHITSNSGYYTSLRSNQDGIIYVPLNLKDEVHTLEFSAPGYCTLIQTVHIVMNCRKEISPYPNFLLKEGQNKLSAVLSWDNPITKDLDIHLVDNYTPSQHVYKGRCKANKPSPTQITLSHKSNSGYGPETITINHPDDNLQYLLVVHNYDKAANLSTSNAKVHLYDGYTFKKTVSCPKQGDFEFGWWIVAMYENQQWRVINKLVDLATSYSTITFQSFSMYLS